MTPTRLRGALEKAFWDMNINYIDNYYARTLKDNRIRQPLRGEHHCEVAIVGGGMAGLATALGLAERGRKAILLDARRVGWGASGRNGGFVSPGYSLSARDLMARVGLPSARRLHRLTQEAMALIERRIDDYAIDCGPVKGRLRISWFDRPEILKQTIAFMNSSFGTAYEFWPRHKVRNLYVSPRYYDAIFDPDAFSFHSLEFVQGVARAAENRGALVFEGSPVRRVELQGERKLLETPEGRVSADQVVFACSAYIGEIAPQIKQATLPIATYVMLTEPLNERLKSAIRAPYGVSDDRFATDYYRPLADGRILWGGRISMRSSPWNLERIMLRDMLKVYPQLRGARAEVAWPGLMGYSRHKMPLIGEIAPGVWSCSNFGGHGMCATTLGGELIASAIAEGDERYKLFEPFGYEPVGGVMGPFAAQCVYWWEGLKDRFRR